MRCETDARALQSQCSHLGLRLDFATRFRDFASAAARALMVLMSGSDHILILGLNLWSPHMDRPSCRASIDGSAKKRGSTTRAPPKYVWSASAGQCSRIHVRAASVSGCNSKMLP